MQNFFAVLLQVPSLVVAGVGREVDSTNFAWKPSAGVKMCCRLEVADFGLRDCVSPRAEFQAALELVHACMTVAATPCRRSWPEKLLAGKVQGHQSTAVSHVVQE